jgi:hypothetical protein
MVALEGLFDNPPLPITTGLVNSLVDRRDDWSVAQKDAAKADMLGKARQAVQPAIAYLLDRFVGTLEKPGPLRAVRELYEACRLCDPLRIEDFTNAQVAALLPRFRHLQDEADGGPARRTALIEELGLYRARAQGLPPTVDIARWWRQAMVALPHWSSLLFDHIALLQPSSAAVERVFSMLDHLFNDEQANTLDDYRRAAIMCRYNELQRDNLRRAREQAAAPPA